MKSSASKLPDTNAIIRYLIKDDKKHYQIAHTFFEKVREGEEKVTVLESIIAECVYVLIKFYHVPKDETVEKLTGFLSYKGVVNKDKKELIEALNMFAEKNIDIVDCILCKKSQNYNMPLFSFDKALNKLAGQAVEG